jgi:hypothetical protein
MSGFLQVGPDDGPAVPWLSSSTFQALLVHAGRFVAEDDDEARHELETAGYVSGLTLTDELASRDLQRRLVDACRSAIPEVRAGVERDFTGQALAEQLASLEEVRRYLDEVARQRHWLPTL